MTDDKLKALAERVVEAIAKVPNWLSDEVLVSVVSEVLRSALTPEWKPVPDELPEGAAYGVYATSSIAHLGCLDYVKIWNREDVRGYRDMKDGGLGRYMLLAAFDANGEVVG